MRYTKLMEIEQDFEAGKEVSREDLKTLLNNYISKDYSMFKIGEEACIIDENRNIKKCKIVDFIVNRDYSYSKYEVKFEDGSLSYYAPYDVTTVKHAECSLDKTAYVLELHNFDDPCGLYVSKISIYDPVMHDILITTQKYNAATWGRYFVDNPEALYCRPKPVENLNSNSRK